MLPPYRHLVVRAQDLETDAFIKYNNGRFFFNAEIDWYWRKQLQYPTLANQAAGTPPQIYNDVEALVYGTEFGACAAPAKCPSSL